MHRETTIGLLGTSISVILVVVGYILDIVVLQVTFSFLAGAFSTYLIQHWLQLETERRTIKRENKILLRDKIYGSLFEAATEALTRLKSGQEMSPPIDGAYSPIEEIKDTMNNYPFLLVDMKTTSAITDICKGLVEYNFLFGKAQEAIYDIAVASITQKYPKVNVYPNSSYFTLREHRTPVVDMTLQDAILNQIDPFEEFGKIIDKIENPTLDIRFHDINPIDNIKVKEIFEEMVERAGKEKRLLDYWARRKSLEKALDDILPVLKQKIEE